MGLATSTVKYALYIFNFVFVLCGIVLLTVGILAIVGAGNYSNTSGGTGVYAGPVTVIVISSIILLISFLGCCGAVRENRCFLNTYAVILMGLFVMQIVIGIYVLVMVKEGGDLETELKTNIEETFEKYKNNDDIQREIDSFQRELNCCGVHSYLDYKKILNIDPPMSCCKKSGCKPSNNQEIFTKGCYDQVANAIKSSLEVLGWVAVGLCVVEIVGALFAICLSSSIKNESRRGAY